MFIELIWRRYQLEAFVDRVKGRAPQTWVDAQDTIDNMKWIEEIYAKVGVHQFYHLAVDADNRAQNGFGSRPPSKYVSQA